MLPIFRFSSVDEAHAGLKKPKSPSVPITRLHIHRQNAIEVSNTVSKTGWSRFAPPIRQGIRSPCWPCLIRRINTGLFVNMAKQRHQVLPVNDRQLTADFPLQASSTLAACSVTFENFEHYSLLWADDSIPTTSCGWNARELLPMFMNVSDSACEQRQRIKEWEI